MVNWPHPQVGSWLNIESNDGEKYSGHLFQYDPKLKFVFLTVPIIPDGWNELPTPLRPSINHQVIMLSLEQVKAVTLGEAPSSQQQAGSPLVRPIKVDRLLRREQKALQKRQIDFFDVPSGVSKEALAIFSALSKTLPCEWHKGERTNENFSTIVVLDEVFVCPPYTPSNVRGTIKSNAAIIERVKKVLECERKRLAFD